MYDSRPLSPEKDLESKAAEGSKAVDGSAGGAGAAATTLAPAFCVLRFDSPSTDYSQCRAAGGHQFTWDQWCPGAVGTRGGDACQVFYLQNDCPTGQAPAGYSWTPPPCP